MKQLIDEQIPKTFLYEIHGWCMYNLMRTLNERFDNPYGKKAMAFATSQVFVYKYKNCFVAYKIMYNNLLKDYMEFNITLHPVKTPDGTVYVRHNTLDTIKNDCVSSYTAHYFDQYTVRTSLVSGNVRSKTNREKAIKDWMVKFLKHTTHKINVDNKQSVQEHHPEGLGLGEFIDENNILFKTFVSNNMLKNDQARISDNLDNGIDIFDSIKMLDEYFYKNKRQLNK